MQAAAPTLDASQWEALHASADTTPAWIERTEAEMTRSYRLDHSGRWLDAEYAVLHEASAIHAALEARLRNSQPLLWRENALVLQRDRSRTRDSRGRDRGLARSGGSFAVSRSHHSDCSSRMKHSRREEEDSSSLAVIDSQQRYRRRVHWEVSKRIARVDRELQTMARPHRFWHVKERERQEARDKKTRVEEHRVAKERRQQEKQEKEDRERTLELERKEEEEKKKKKRAEAVNKRINVARTSTQNQPPSSGSRGPSPAPVVLLDGLDYEAGDTGNEKENNPLCNQERSEDASGTNKLTPESSSPLKKAQDHSDEATLQRSVPPSSRHSNDSLPRQESVSSSSLAEVEDQSIPIPGEVKQRGESHHLIPNNSVHISPRGSIDGDAEERLSKAAPPLAEPPHRGNEKEDSKRQHGSSSSLGRQVLSEHRSMPMGPSFGESAVLLASGGSKRLNGDVLRRLFSDLDTDRDGHLNRIETCLALNRLHIVVPAPKIVAFFKRLHSINVEDDQVGSATKPKRSAQGSRSRYQPLDELINFKQFVAFVTAAFDRQQQQQQQRERELERTKHQGPSRLLHSTPRSPLGSKVLCDGTSAHCPERGGSIVQQPRMIADVGAHQQSELVSVLAGRGEQEDDAKVSVVTYPSVTKSEFYQAHASLEERILKQLPEYLVNQAITEDTQTINNRRARNMQETSMDVVRRSLEGVFGTTTVDDRTVNIVTEEVLRRLIQELRANGTDDHEGNQSDVSGLLRAAAFFEYDPRSAGVVPAVDTDEARTNTEGWDHPTGDWWDILTEEQVTSIVQEIIRQRQASQQRDEMTCIEHFEAGRNDTPARSEDGATTHDIKNATAMPVSPEDRTLSRSESILDESVVVNDPIDAVYIGSQGAVVPTPTPVLMVAEKGIQTGSVEWTQAPILEAGGEGQECITPGSAPSEDVPSPSAAPSSNKEVVRVDEPTMTRMRTTLACAILQLNHGSLQPTTQRSARSVIPSTAESVLYALRRRRRRRHQHTVDETPSISHSDDSPGQVHELSEYATAIDDKESKVNSDPEAKPLYNMPQDANEDADDEGAQPEAVPPLLLKETLLRIPTAVSSECPQGRDPDGRLEFRSVSSSVDIRSSLSSRSGRSSARSSSSGNESFPSYGPSTWIPPPVVSQIVRQCRANVCRRKFDKTPRRNSTHSEDSLSDGEIAPTHGMHAGDGDLSDGEIYGPARRRVMRTKNRALAQMDGTTDEPAIASSVASVESGEIPSAILLHQNYRNQLMGSNVSSLESGEFETGVLTC